MGKKIRHLEPYGYVDQNVYNGFFNIDLSDIHEVNREQDSEIDVLSATVENLISTQGNINSGLSEAISANTVRISALEDKTDEIISTVNVVSDSLDLLSATVESISAHDEDIAALSAYTESAISAVNETIIEKTNEVSSALTEHIDTFNSYSAATKDLIDTKLDIETAEDTYAKKVDTYTKADVDLMIKLMSGDVISDYATKKWVEDKEYLNEVSADEIYTRKGTTSELSGKIDGINSTLTQQVTELSTDLDTYKTKNDTRLEILSGKVTTLESKHDREISELKDKDASLQNQITAATYDIKTINEISLPSKADASALAETNSNLSNLSNAVNDKVDKGTFDQFNGAITAAYNQLNETKANKTYVDSVSAYAESVSAYADTIKASLETEIKNREDADDALDNRIDEANIHAKELSGTITSVSGALATEINDRKVAISGVVGTSEDNELDYTIYGTRAYAYNQSQSVLRIASSYTNTSISDLKNYVDSQDHALSGAIGGKLDTTAFTDIKGDIEEEIASGIAQEASARTATDTSLKLEIQEERKQRISADTELISALTDTSNVVHAITEWEGNDAASYIDSGNGILDVLHREFHQLKNQLGKTSGIVTTYSDEVAFGSYNISHSGLTHDQQTLLSVGNGTEGNPSNALELMRNGDLWLWVEGEFMPINNLLAQLAHEEY